MIVVLAMAAIVAVLWGQRAEEPRVIESPEPAVGGVFYEGVVGSLMRLNPQLAEFNPVDQDVTGLLFNGLIRFDSKGLPQPDLANSWGLSRTGEIYNFSLREDVQWHDGEPFTSQDVVFTVSLLKHEDFPYPEDLKDFWQEIEVEALNEYTLQFRLPEPFAPFLDYLNFGIVPEHILGEIPPAELVEAEFNIQPVGTGPFQFDGLILDGEEITGVSLVQNQQYHGAEPLIEQVVFLYYPNHQALWEAYQAGDVHGVREVTLEILQQALDDPTLSLYTSRLPKMSLALLNLDNPEVPFFQEREIRRALMLGLNRQWIVDQILEGQAVPATGPIFPKTWAYFEGLEPIPYQPERSVEILRDAGYSIPADGGSVRVNEEGEALEFTLVYPDQPLHQQIAETMQRNWEQIGFGVELEPLPYQELISDQLEPRIYQAALVDLNLTRTPDPDPYPFWHQAQTSGGQNYSMWNDRQASQYLEQARIVLDPAERERLYKNFQVRFMDQLPALPLYYPMYNYGVSDEVNGVRIGPIFDPADRLNTLEEWYFYSEIPGGLGDTSLAP